MRRNSADARPHASGKKRPHASGHAKRTQRLQIAVACSIVTVIIAAGILLRSARPEADLALEVGKLLIIVAGNITVGGFLSLLVFGQLAERDRENDLGHQRAESLANAQQELKAGFDRVQVARYLLLAEPTAATLVKELPRLFSARESLQRAERERFIVVQHASVRPAIQRMLESLTAVVDEYVKNAAALRAEAIRCERAVELFKADDRRELNLPLLTGDPRLPNLNAFMSGDTRPAAGEQRYVHAEFLTNYQMAKNEIETALREST